MSLRDHHGSVPPIHGPRLGLGGLASPGTPLCLNDPCCQHYRPGLGSGSRAIEGAGAVIVNYEPLRAELAHRLLAPRVGYVVGTCNLVRTPNCCVASNVTSVSRAPQLVVISISKEWLTYRNLVGGSDFTLTTPRAHQQQGLWRLAEKYSGFAVPEGESKLDASGLQFDRRSSDGLPILRGGIGWMVCKTVHTVEVRSDHGIFIGEVLEAGRDPAVLSHDARYMSNSQPWMQVTGNTFSTSTDYWQVPYYQNESL